MDTLTPEQRHERMSRVRGRDTKPEMAVRRLLHGLGYRYRLKWPGLPGRPDVIFPGRRKAVFVHGCFWHRHPGCCLARLPKSRLDFWLPKLEGNRERDARNLAALAERGWEAFVVWECELADKVSLRQRLVDFLGGTKRMERA